MLTLQQWQQQGIHGALPSLLQFKAVVCVQTLYHMFFALGVVVADSVVPKGNLSTWKAHNWNGILFHLTSFTRKDLAEKDPALFSMKQVVTLEIVLPQQLVLSKASTSAQITWLHEHCNCWNVSYLFILEKVFFIWLPWGFTTSWRLLSG